MEAQCREQPILSGKGGEGISSRGDLRRALKNEEEFSRQRRRKTEDNPHRINSMNKTQKNQRAETIWNIVRRPEPGGDEAACSTRYERGLCRSC